MTKMYKLIECKACGKINLHRGFNFCQTCYNRDYYKRNRKKILEKLKQYRPKYMKKNKEKYKKYMKVYNALYQEKHKERLKIASAQYRNTEEFKIHKKEYDKKRRNELRFGGNKEKALKRDNYSCQICGIKKNLHTHHTDNKGRRYKGNINNSIDNLITLCKNCHHSLHSKKIWKERKKRLKKSDTL